MGKEHREPTEANSRYYIGEKRPQSPERNRFNDSGYRKSRSEKDYPNKSKISSRYGERSNDFESLVQHDGRTRDSYYENKIKLERKRSSSDSNSSRDIKDLSSDSNSSFEERSSTP